MFMDYIIRMFRNTLGGPSKALVQYNLALSTRLQYVVNAFANLLCEFNCDLTLTALLHMIALLEKCRLFCYKQ